MHVPCLNRSLLLGCCGRPYYLTASGLPDLLISRQDSVEVVHVLIALIEGSARVCFLKCAPYRLCSTAQLHDIAWDHGWASLAHVNASISTSNDLLDVWIAIYLWWVQSTKLWIVQVHLATEMALISEAGQWISKFIKWLLLLWTVWIFVLERAHYLRNNQAILLILLSQAFEVSCRFLKLLLCIRMLLPLLLKLLCDELFLAVQCSLLGGYLSV